MKQLLYRDWTLIRKSRTIYLGLFYLAFLIPNNSNTFMMNYSSNFLFIFVVYLFFSYLTAYDYKYNGLTFTAALPISKQDMVVSRYIFLSLAYFIYLLFLILIKMLIIYIQDSTLFVNYAQIGIYTIAFTVIFSFIIPLYYKYGYQKMRWVMFIGMFVAVITTTIVQDAGLNLNTPQFMVLTLIFSSIIYWISMQISCKILMNKDL